MKAVEYVMRVPSRDGGWEYFPADGVAPGLRDPRLAQIVTRLQADMCLDSPLAAICREEAVNRDEAIRDYLAAVRAGKE